MSSIVRPESGWPTHTTCRLAGRSRKALNSAQCRLNGAQLETISRSMGRSANGGCGNRSGFNQSQGSVARVFKRGWKRSSLARSL